jgi:hypothetical protein
MEAFCEYGNELSGFMKFSKIFQLLIDCWLLKENSAPWIQLITFSGASVSPASQVQATLIFYY